MCNYLVKERNCGMGMDRPDYRQKTGNHRDSTSHFRLDLFTDCLGIRALAVQRAGTD
jgi:hypothetical protein